MRRMIDQPKLAEEPSVPCAALEEWAMIVRGPHLAVPIPDVSLPEFIFEGVERRLAMPALIDGASGRVLTYGQLADGVRRSAAGLAARGFRKGDVFATAVPNIPEFAIAFYAVASLGGATTMLNPLYTVEEMTTQLADAGARAVLTAPERLDTVAEAARRAGIADLFIVGSAAGAIPFASLLEYDGQAPAVAVDPAEDVVALPYSSGTTGRPKGVMLTHRNLIAHVQFYEASGQSTDGSTSVVVFPFFHVGGLSVLNTCLHAGATLVLLRRYDFRTFLRLIQDYQATRVTLPPPVVLDLARDPVVDEYDLGSLRHIQWGAAPLSESVLQACRVRLGCRVKQGYALSEASSRTHSVPWDADDRPGSAGPPGCGIECTIVDPGTGDELPPGKTGEICIRGPIVMKGYLNNSEATARAIDADGRLHTGDLGYVDEDGWLYVVDRLKELIKHNGYQVAPAELEAILLGHPAVADVAVVPSPDERAGEVPKAFVVLEDEVTAEELMAYVAVQVAPYKKVRRVEFVDQIPKSPTGKILRRVLVERERAAMLTPV
jgi:acyl-CoA synthetase (AMP-forming)/AMP-acid ligase II